MGECGGLSAGEGGGGITNMFFNPRSLSSTRSRVDKTFAFGAKVPVSSPGWGRCKSNDDLSPGAVRSRFPF